MGWGIGLEDVTSPRHIRLSVPPTSVLRRLPAFHGQGSIPLARKVEEITRGVNRKCLLDVLKNKGWVVCDASGRVRETHSIGGKNKRGIAFIPECWEGVPKGDSSNLSLETACSLEQI